MNSSNRQVSDVLLVLLMLAIGAACYAHTLQAPFVYDDAPNILGNQSLRISDLSPGTLFDAAFGGILKTRPLAYLTFALNYYFHGYAEPGYHMVNIAIHLVAGVFLYLLLKAILRTGVFNATNTRNKRMIAFFGALVWMVHPVQTQSVTYIVQRMNSMAGMFYVMSLFFYVQARCRRAGNRPAGPRSADDSAGMAAGAVATVKPVVVLLYGLSAGAGFLALCAKEIAFTLPVMIFLIEWFFFQDLDKSWGLKYGAAMAGGLLVLMGIGAVFVDTDLFSYRYYHFGPLQRVMTEFRVVATYAGLLLFPHPGRLNLDYSYTVSKSLFDPPTTLLSLFFVIALVALAVGIVRRQRLAAFGIFWFLINLVIESSVIPLDIIFEHRLYLPSMMVWPVIVAVALKKIPDYRIPAAIFTAVAVLFSVWTYDRNTVWRDRETLWRDAVGKAPRNSNAVTSLGRAVMAKGRFDEAFVHFKKAVKLEPRNEEAHYRLGLVYMRRGEYRHALEHLETAVELDPDYPETFLTIGNAYFGLGEYRAAVASYSEALKQNPGYANALANRGAALVRLGRISEAGTDFRRALAISPDHPTARANLENLASSSKTTPASKTYPAKAVEQSGGVGTHPSRVQDPLDHALGLLNFSKEDFVTPFHYGQGYHLVAGNPQIDSLAGSPFTLTRWALDTSLIVQTCLTGGGPNSVAVLNGMLAGNSLPMDAGPPPVVDTDLDRACRRIFNDRGAIRPEKALHAIRSNGFTSEFENQLAILMTAVLDGNAGMERALMDLSAAERRFIADNPERFFFPDLVRFNFLTAPVHTQTRMAAVAGKIDFAEMINAGSTIDTAVSAFTRYGREAVQKGPEGSFFADRVDRKGLLVDLDTPVGRVVVFGGGDDVFDGQAAIVIDLGGNDRWGGIAGDVRGDGGGISVLVDLAGDDHYGDARESRSNGFGVLSIGLISDAEGDDRYTNGDMGQGCGLFGIGILKDLEGNDTYSMGLMGQGFGLFGFGALLDTAGNDSYIVRGMGQGSGSTLGLGLLCDGQGSDSYLADRDRNRSHRVADEWCHAQGAGFSIRSPDWKRFPSFYGGIGFLSDRDGDDTYNASHGNSMGSSYFMSVGALVDHGGNDIYIPRNGYSIGYAVHLANAVLVDVAGDDRYYAVTHTGGVGSDRSTAVLVDYEGDDVYGPAPDIPQESVGRRIPEKTLGSDPASAQTGPGGHPAAFSYGVAKKPKAFGLLMDYTGNDRYYAGEKGRVESCGGVIPPVQPEDWSRAILLDFQGRDFYSQKGRRDNHYFLYYGHGVCYDTEAATGYSVEREERAYAQSRPWDSRTRELLGRNSIGAKLLKLSHAGPHMRHAVVSEIASMGSDVFDDLVSVAVRSLNRDLNSAIVEIITWNLTSGSVGKPEFRVLAPLLAAEDEHMRRFCALMFKWWRVRSQEAALVETLEDPGGHVREAVISALGAVGSPRSVSPLIEAYQAGNCLNCTRAAVQSLGLILKRETGLSKKEAGDILALMLSALSNPDAVTRKIAAAALGSSELAAGHARELRARLEDEDVYVRRAAARSMVQSGHEKGVPVLIETLGFPSIDTFRHYDHELANELAFYCGVDFKEPARYDVETWRSWWLENGRSVDLAENLANMRAVAEAFAAEDEDAGIRIFEDLLEKQPGNIVIVNRYKRFCYEWITFRLMTLPEITDPILQRAVKIQRIRVGLDPSRADLRAGLANMLFQTGDVHGARESMRQAVRLDPGNAEYGHAIEAYDRVLIKRDENAGD